MQGALRGAGALRLLSGGAAYARRRAASLVAYGALLALLAAACSDGTGAGSAPRERPAGPAADVSEEIGGGAGPFMGSPDGFATPDGYVDHEYVAAGTATAYEPQGELTDDGRWSFAPSTTAEYRTRVFVRRTERRADASGTVIVEWLNVSGGVDANPEYFTLAEEIVRRGHTWVGVSAQLIGVEGGPVLVTAPGGEGLAGEGLKRIDPVRYGSLQHPGDGYAFDIFTQVARAVLQGGALLGGARPSFVLAAGESQSAIALTTYYDGVQPLTLAFDGFFMHSRASSSLQVICVLLGSTRPLPESRAAELYPSRADYVQRYEAATADAVAAGFVLEEDSAALLAYAQPSRIAP